MKGCLFWELVLSMRSQGVGRDVGTTLGRLEGKVVDTPNAQKEGEKRGSNRHSMDWIADHQKVSHQQQPKYKEGKEF